MVTGASSGIGAAIATELAARGYTVGCLSGQRERFLPVILDGGLGALAITEQTGGSDATAMRTSMRPVGDEILVSSGPPWQSARALNPGSRRPGRL